MSTEPSQEVASKGHGGNPVRKYHRHLVNKFLPEENQMPKLPEDTIFIVRSCSFGEV
jgi:hypothetical protein